MKLVINKTNVFKFLLFLVFGLLYTYFIVYFTTTKMIKNESVDKLYNFIIIQELLHQNQTEVLNKYLDNRIDGAITFYKMSYFDYFDIKNPNLLYNALFELNNKRKVCKAISESSNINDKEFLNTICKK